MNTNPRKQITQSQLPNVYPVGWDDGQTEAFGFRAASLRHPINFDCSGHQLTFGITGAGKAVSAAIPELLSFAGNVASFDVKAELFHVTSRWRQQSLQQQVVLLDPFNVSGYGSDDGLNPLDIVRLLDVSAYEAANMIACLITGTSQPTSLSRGSENQDFWRDQATQLLVGLIGAALENKLPDAQTLVGIRSLLKSDDAVYNMAVILDNNPPSKLFKEEIASFLQTVEVTRSGILSTLTSYFRGLAGDGIDRLLSKTTFDLHGFVHGSLPATIYFVIPPEQLAAQSKLVRLVFGILMSSLFTRRYIPRSKTLVQIDEAATLGWFDPWRTGVTLFRGNGVSFHAMFQDVDQLLTTYPDARTLISNTSLVRILGASNQWQANIFADMFGFSPRFLTTLKGDEQVLVLNGEWKRCQRVNYLRDTYFAGRFEPNPRYLEFGLEKSNDVSSQR